MALELRRLSAIEHLVLRLYGWGMWCLQPLLKRKLLRRGQQEAGYLQDIGQRLGHYPGIPSSSGWLWVHAVSLGETRAAGILLRELRRLRPGVKILLTHGTATGRAEGEKYLHPGDVQVWQPWDTPGAIARFLKHFKPQMGVLIETEVWPHWVHACATQGIPLHLVNARMSAATLSKALRLPWLARPAYGRLNSVLAQTQDDAKRLRCLGAPVHGVMGNLKFDVCPSPEQRCLGLHWRKGTQRPVVMLASSREGEEAMWLHLLDALGDAAHDVQWLVVPRHPQRFQAVAQQIGQAGWQVARRSEWLGGDLPPQAERTIWLGDSLGEMPAYYHLASVAWLGGSFAPLGGQNLIEAAACDCPVVMGPHTYNFAEAAQQAVLAGVACRVKDMHEAWAVTRHWLSETDRFQAARLACHQWLDQGRGAALRCAQSLQ